MATFLSHCRTSWPQPSGPLHLEQGGTTQRLRYQHSLLTHLRRPAEPRCNKGGTVRVVVLEGVREDEAEQHGLGGAGRTSGQEEAEGALSPAHTGRLEE